ncbi:MAG: flagellar hook-length control protein FliK [Chania sp.]
MNLTLPVGLLAAGDNLALGETALPLSDAELSSAFAQLLSERFSPEGKPNGKLMAAQLQAAVPDAPALSRSQLNPLLEQAGLLSSAEPQAVLIDTSPRLDEQQQKSDEAPLPPAATLQALFAILPALPPPQPSGSAIIGEQSQPEATELLSTVNDKPTGPVPNQAQQKAPTAVADKTPLAVKAAPTPFAPDSQADQPPTLPKLAAEPAQPSAAIAYAPTPAVASPVAATTPPTPQLHAPLGSAEWQQALSQQVLLFQRNGQQNAKLRLHPQELGALQIRLTLDDNQVQLHITSAQGQVRSAVEAALPQLRQALAENGINLGQSSVGGESLPSPQQNSHSGGQPAYRQQHGRAESHMQNLDTPAALQAMARSAEGVDIFA